MDRTFTPLFIPCLLIACAPAASNAQGTATAVITNTEMAVRLNSWGTIGENATNGLPAFEVPAGGGNHALYSSGLWISGTDGGNQVHSAAVMFGPMNDGDYWTGPLTNDGSASIQPGTAAVYDQVWCVTKAEIDQHRAYFDCLADPGCDPAVQFPNYQVPPNFLLWPAMGNVNLDLDLYQAPWLDRNGDGVYVPGDGDSPCILGDVGCYYVYNDQRPHTLTATTPLGIEVKVMPFMYITGDQALANTLFVRMHLINRSTLTYSGTNIGLFTDFDLGNPNDDLIGTDAARNLWYVYNADNLDEASASGPGYGVGPPAFGVALLKGPLADANGADDPTGNSLPAWNGLGFGDLVADNERLGLVRTRYFGNASSAMGNPSLPGDFATYLGTTWLDGTPQTYGGTGYSTNPSAVPANYVYPGSSDPGGAGTGGAVQAPWTELSAGNAPGDRRMMGVTGPFTLEPGEHVDLMYAYVYARTGVGGNLANITALQQRVDSVAAFAATLPIWSWGEVEALEEACSGLIGSGVADRGTDELLRFFPIPAQEVVVVECPAGLAGAALVLHDALGRAVRTQRLVEGRNTIELNELPAGVYIATANTATARYTGRVVKE